MHKNNMCVIYDSDTKYAMKLMNVINSDKQIPFGAQVFTEQEQLCSYLESYEPKILMISEDVGNYALTNSTTSQVVVLCDEENQVEKTENSYGDQVIGVYKYQSSSRILKKIIQQGSDAIAGEEIETKFIGVIGADACSRNILSIVIAYLMGEMKSVLYINLDEFSGLDNLFPSEHQMNLSDAFYVYKQNGYQYCDEIRKTINHGEHMDYISPVQCADDISYMEPLRVIQFANCVGQELGYHYIVLDIASGVRTSWHLLEKCDFLFIPQTDQEWIARKQRAMEQYFLETGMEHLVDKLSKISMMPEPGFMGNDFWNHIACSASTRYMKEIINKQILAGEV